MGASSTKSVQCEFHQVGPMRVPPSRSNEYSSNIKQVLPQVLMEYFVTGEAIGRSRGKYTKGNGRSSDVAEMGMLDDECVSHKAGWNK